MAKIIEFPKGGRRQWRIGQYHARAAAANALNPVEVRLALACSRRMVDRAKLVDQMATSIGVACIACRTQATTRDDAGAGGLAFRILDHFTALVEKLEKL